MHNITTNHAITYTNIGCLVCESFSVVILPFLLKKLNYIYIYIFRLLLLSLSTLLIVFFFGFVGRSWSFWAWFLQRFPLFFSPFSRVFCRGFSWPPSVSCRYVPKTPLIFPDVVCDVFFTIPFFTLSWSSIKRSDLLRHNKPEVLLGVICVLGNLLLRTEWELKPLLSDHRHLLAVPTKVISLLSPLLSGHQALDTLSSVLFQEYDGEYSPG